MGTRDMTGESRGTIEQRHETLRGKFEQSDRVMNDGVESKLVVDKTATELIARMTSEGRLAVEGALDRAQEAAAEHVEREAAAQGELLAGDADPFADAQRENAEATRDDAERAQVAAGEARVAEAARALDQASRELGMDAAWLGKMADQQKGDNEGARKNADQKQAAARAPRAPLRTR